MYTRVLYQSVSNIAINADKVKNKVESCFQRNKWTCRRHTYRDILTNRNEQVTAGENRHIYLPVTAIVRGNSKSPERNSTVTSCTERRKKTWRETVMAAISRQLFHLILSCTATHWNPKHRAGVYTAAKRRRRGCHYRFFLAFPELNIEWAEYLYTTSSSTPYICVCLGWEKHSQKWFLSLFFFFF